MQRAHTRPLTLTMSLEQLEDRVVPAGLIGDLVSFGDSLSDVGNVSLTTGGTIPPSEFYFQGRYSGGAIWVDTLAEYLGEATPTAALAGGLNYAAGGARLTDGYNPYGTPTLSEQINQFYLPANSPDADDVFTLWGGANDFFFSGGTADLDAVSTAMFNAIKDLYDAGGRTFVVANLPLLGQTPYFQDLLDLGFIDQTVVDGANLWSGAYNFFLDVKLDALAALPGIHLIEVDTAGILADLTDLTKNPLELTNFTDAIGPYDANGFLTDITAVNPNDFLFHDSVHPGSRAQQYIGLQAAAGVLNSLGVSTVVVKTTADTIDPLDGKISLREAANLANTQVGEQTILFALGHGNKTIALGSEIAITDATNILGPGTNKLGISGQDATRIFSIEAGVDVTLSGMTLRDGRADQGGAILNAGNLTVVDVDFRNNTASGANASGGAIHNTGNLSVWLSAFQGNSAVGTSTAFGGAIASVGPDAHAQVILSRLTQNEARAPLAQGGAIHAGAESSLSLLASKVTGNKAQGTSGGEGQGGGIYVDSDALFSSFLSVITGNKATTAGKNVFLD